MHTIDIESLEHEQREQLRSVLLALKAKQLEAQSAAGQAARWLGSL